MRCSFYVIPRSRCLFFSLTCLAPLLLLLSGYRPAPEPRSVPSNQGVGSAHLWDTKALSRPPQVQWGTTTGLVQELYYEGEPLQGHATRVFAYLARPIVTNAQGKLISGKRLPAMVLVHGGGGKAFKEWAEHWARVGYVALAMDLSGHGPAGRSPDGMPEQSDESKFRNFSEADARDMWSYHAVAAVVRGNSLVRSLPEVDANRVGITGISWGGYLTCIVAGVDPRFKVAVPVYGCGFLGEDSYWKDKSLAAMNPEARDLWLRLFDPSAYLGRVRYPILFVNGTTDFAYPMDSYQKSYRLVPEKWRHVSMLINRPHGHIWTFPEVDVFVNSVLKSGLPLVRVGKPIVENGRLSATLDRHSGLKEMFLCYTTNSGPWQKRAWQKIPARLEENRLLAELPPARPLTAFLSLKDERDAQVSSEHVELTGPSNL